MNILFVGIGGFFGAISRYLVNLIIMKYLRLSFPLGTLTVNVVGSLIMGLFAGYLLNHSPSRGIILLVTTGFLGAFTTFSTFSLENWQLFESSSYKLLIINILANLILTFVAVAVGIIFMKSVR